MCTCSPASGPSASGPGPHSAPRSVSTLCSYGYDWARGSKSWAFFSGSLSGSVWMGALAALRPSGPGPGLGLWGCPSGPSRADGRPSLSQDLMTCSSMWSGSTRPRGSSSPSLEKGAKGIFDHRWLPVSQQSLKSRAGCFESSGGPARPLLHVHSPSPGPYSHLLQGRRHDMCLSDVPPPSP